MSLDKIKKNLKSVIDKSQGNIAFNEMNEATSGDSLSIKNLTDADIDLERHQKRVDSIENSAYRGLMSSERLMQSRLSSILDSIKNEETPVGTFSSKEGGDDITEIIKVINQHNLTKEYYEHVIDNLEGIASGAVESKKNLLEEANKIEADFHKARFGEESMTNVKRIIESPPIEIRAKRLPWQEEREKTW
tara:strand:+ start:119 stop:691 length:573 start_codon:yes stop_codon:yes gene_type:complete